MSIPVTAVGEVAAKRSVANPHTVIIVSYGRSGTTLLQALFNSAPGVCIRGEAEGAPMKLWATIDALAVTKAKRGLTPTRNPNHPWHGAATIDVDGFARAAVAGYVANVLRPPPTADVIGFKTIRWLAMSRNSRFACWDFFAHHFPNCRLVFNMRYHNDVAASGFWRKHPAEVVDTWLRELDEDFMAYVKRHPQHLICHYNIWSDPAQGNVREAMFRVLGIPYNKAVADKVLATRLTH